MRVLIEIMFSDLMQTTRMFLSYSHLAYSCLILDFLQINSNRGALLSRALNPLQKRLM